MTAHDSFFAEPATEPPTRKGVPNWIKVLGVLAAVVVVLGCCGGGAVFMLSGGKAPARATYHPPAAGSSTGGTTAAPTHSAAPASPTTKAPPAAATVKNGEWTAGTDFPVGTYETTTTSDTCVWQVTTGQGESVHYVDPGHIGPGHYKFAFKAGQTLHTVGCGTWTKTG